MTSEARAAAVRPGRPLDPAIDGRVIAAVQELFVEGGWAGLSMDAIARRAGVGKAALYRRWAGKQELVESMLDAVAEPYAAIDAGSLHQDLTLWATQMLTDQLSDRIWFLRRVSLEARVLPELFGPVAKRFRQANIDIARRIVRKAMARGELPRDTRVGFMLDLLVGAVATHADTVRSSTRKGIQRSSHAFIADLVDFLCRNFGATEPAAHST